MGTKRAFLKNSAVSGSYTYFILFLEFISTVFLSRLLLPEEYGFVAIIIIFSGYIDMFSRLSGLQQAIIRSDYGSKFHKLIFNVTVWLGLVQAIILIALAYPISVFFSDTKLILATIITAISFIGNTIIIVPTAVLLKRMDFNVEGRYRFISYGISIILMIVFAYLGFSYWALIIPTTIRPFINYILLEFKVKLGFHIFGWKLTKLAIIKVKDLLITLAIFNSVNYWTQNLANLLVGKRFGQYDIGIYNRSYKFLRLGIKLINGIFGRVLLPSLKKEIEEKTDYKQNFLDILDIVHLAGFLFSIILVLFPTITVKILWGENWLDVAKYMPYFGIIIPLQTLIIACDDLYVLEYKEKAILSVGIPAAIILIVSIIIGSFFTTLDVARSFTIGFAMVQVPFHVIYGHYKVLRFPKKMLVRFWLPKVLFVNSVLLSIWFAPPYFTYMLYGVYSVYLAIGHWSNFKKISSLVKSRLNNRNK